MQFAYLDELLEEQESNEEDQPVCEVGTIALGLIDSGHFSNEISAIRILSKNSFFFLSQSEIDFFNRYSSFNIRIARHKSWIINSFINAYNFNFDQALAWSETTIKIWILQGIDLVKNNKLPMDIFLMITTYLSPLQLKDASELFDKATYQCNKNFLINDLKAYQRLSVHLFFKKREHSATILQNRIEHATNLDELKNAIKPDEKEDYVLKQDSKKRVRIHQSVVPGNLVLDQIIRKFSMRLSLC